MNPTIQPWLYVQSTGELFRPDGSFCAAGYSGRGDGLNNPIFQTSVNEGPIPQGLYDLGKVDEEKGPFTIRLSPHSGNTMYGRSGFLVHGDNKEVNHSASEGCIVMCLLARIELANGGSIRVIDKPAPIEKLA